MIKLSFWFFLPYTGGLPENQTTYYYNGGSEDFNRDGITDDKLDVAATHRFTNDNNNDELLCERGLAGPRAQIFFLFRVDLGYAPLSERLTYIILSSFPCSPHLLLLHPS